MLGEEDILDIDRAELLLGQDLGMDTLSDDDDDEDDGDEDEEGSNTTVRSSRPMSAYRGGR